MLNERSTLYTCARRAHLDALGGVGLDVRVALHVVPAVLPVPHRAPRDAVPARAQQRRGLVAGTGTCRASVHVRLQGGK